MRFRAAAESLRLPPPPRLPPTTPLNALIALSNFARSAFNCARTAPRSVILVLPFLQGKINNWGHHIERTGYRIQFSVSFDSIPRDKGVVIERSR